MVFVFLCGFLTATALADDSAPGRAIPDLGTRASGHDWPTFLGPSGDNKSAETGVSAPWPPAGPPVLWTRPLGESYGIGSVSRGRFLQFDHQAGHAQLLCLHSETGQLLWEFRYPSEYRDLYGYNAGPRCSPVIDEDRVYIYGVEGMLHCLHLDTGKLLWKVDTVEQFGVVQNFFGVGSTPVIYNDLLLVIVGGSPAESQTLPPGRLDLVASNGTAVVALDKRTGQVRYQVGDDLASYASLRVVQRADRDWCFAFLRGGLLALEPGTGKQDFYFPWRARTLESVNASTPVIVGDRVFISETYGPGSALLRFAPDQYEVVWQDDARRRAKAMQAHWNTPVYHDGYLYGSSGRHMQNAELRCIEWETGKVMWSEPGLARCSLLYVDGYLVCLAEDGILRLLRANPQRYDLVSQVMLRAEPPSETEAGQASVSRPLLKYPAWAAPVLSHGLLYLRGSDRLVCLELIPEKSSSAD